MVNSHDSNNGYSPSLWSQAPEGATHCGLLSVRVDRQLIDIRVFLKERDGLFYWMDQMDGVWRTFPRPESDFTYLHERPQCFKTPEQLIAEYRKEHGAEIEADAQTFFDSLTEDAQSSKDVLQLDHLLYDALFHLTLLEKHLAAERARIEGAGK